jgi:hypothetical protein
MVAATGFTNSFKKLSPFFVHHLIKMPLFFWHKTRFQNKKNQETKNTATHK